MIKDISDAISLYIFEEDSGFDLDEALNVTTIRNSVVSIRMFFIILCRSAEMQNWF